MMTWWMCGARNKWVASRWERCSSMTVRYLWDSSDRSRQMKTENINEMRQIRVKWVQIRERAKVKWKKGEVKSAIGNLMLSLHIQSHRINNKKINKIDCITYTHSRLWLLGELTDTFLLATLCVSFCVHRTPALSHQLYYLYSIPLTLSCSLPSCHLLHMPTRFIQNTHLPMNNS